jgi:fructosamine-3-kinase
MTLLPSPVREGVEGALNQLGASTVVVDARAVAGGCINHGAKIDTADGRSYFVKWNASASPRMFEAEADGLRVLAEACPLRVPRPLMRGGGAGVPTWLVMEYIAPGRRSQDYETALGRGLAELHSTSRRSEFGWAFDNWIGALPQANPTTASWTEFWRDHRLVPQWAESRRRGYLDRTADQLFDRLTALIPTALEDVEDHSPSVIHGDLWSGNTFADESGAPVIIDPAIYAGHGEVDLAMAGLFGGFGPDFHRAYEEILPIAEAYSAYRKDLYQLYYLLVHVNLFGSGYAHATVEAASRVVGALS